MDILDALMNGGNSRQGNSANGKMLNVYITAILKIKAASKNFTVPYTELNPALRDEVAYQVGVINMGRIALGAALQQAVMAEIDTMFIRCFGKYDDYVEAFIEGSNKAADSVEGWEEAFKAVVKDYNPEQGDDE